MIVSESKQPADRPADRLIFKADRGFYDFRTIGVKNQRRRKRPSDLAFVDLRAVSDTPGHCLAGVVRKLRLLSQHESCAPTVSW